MRFNPLPILKTATFRESTLTFSATLINGVLGMLFYIFVARTLGPSDFGLFALSVTVLALVADIGNFGVNTGIVNFVSKYLTSDPLKSQKFLKLGLLAKLIFSLIVIIAGFFLSPYLAIEVFAKPELLSALRLVFLGVGTTWLFSFTTSYYQAASKFVSWGVIQIVTNSIRLVGVFVFSHFSHLNLQIAIIFYIVAPLVGFLTSFINISLDFIKSKIEKNIRSEFFNYNKWVAIFGGISAFSSRSDTFVLGKLVQASELGLYSAANQIVQVIPQLIGAIGTVVAPKYSAFSDDQKMIAYFKKLQIMVLGISVGILICTPIIKIVIDQLYGSEYKESFAIFMILLSAMLVFLISIPVHNAIIYYYSYPKLFSYLSIVHLFIVLPAAYFLTLNYGVKFTAYSILLGNTVNFIIPLIWFIKKVKSNLTRV